MQKAENRSHRRKLRSTVARCAALVFLSAILAGSVSAQTAQDYFHNGAKGYIGNKLDEAATSVDTGLAIAPDDADLLSLKELIEKAKEEQQKQQQEQEQQEQQDQQDEQEQQDQQDQDQQEQQDSGEQSEQDQENQQEQDQQNQDQEQGDEQSDEEKQGGEQESDSDNQGQGQSAPENAEPDPDQLSREEAERILQALENEEGQLLRQVQKMKVRARRVEKDW
jgi:Ca-activated chloride channel family protein